MKRYLILIFAFQLFFACNSNSQNFDNKNPAKTAKTKGFKIDSIADYTGSEERTSAFIKNRLAKLIGNSVKKKCDEIEVSYPPKFVMYRFFKLEKEFEIWVADKRSDTLKLLVTLPVCSADFEPGTKIYEGDGKTPEGFYNSSNLYGSSYSFMWIKLNNSELDNFGNVRYGSSFKICIDYPLAIDRVRTKKTAPGFSPGGAICLHGNCVSAGCISFRNKDFLPVFYTSITHNINAYGKVEIHIFPFRFSEELKQKYAAEVHSKMTAEQILEFWNKIEVGYNLFEKHHKALKITTSGNKYFFSEY